MFNFIDIIDGRRDDGKIGCLANYFTTQNIFDSLQYFLFAGRIPSLHRGSVAACEDLRIHVVQPPGCEEKTFQET